MARGRNSGGHSIGHANFSSNRICRIKAEIKKAEKKMKKLLRLFTDGKPRHCRDTVRKTQGMVAGSQRHKNLQAHISMLKGKI